MKEVLVDTSIWVDYFRSGKHAYAVDFLINENILAINDLILAELIPFLRIKNEKKVIQLLLSIKKIPLLIDWHIIIDLQVTCLHHGINKVGISDLLIVHNALQHNIPIYTSDKHFSLISTHIPLKLYTDKHV